MPPSRRERAAKRLPFVRALKREGLPIDEAVKLSGQSYSRFYRLAADWYAEPGLKMLAAVGLRAAGSRLDPKAVSAGQAVVAKVVRRGHRAEISQLFYLMIEAADISKGAELFGETRLQRIFEDELRRVAGQGKADSEVSF